MVKLILRPIRQKAYTAVAVPMLFVFLLASIVLLRSSLKEAYSLCLGGLIWFLPNGYFAFKCFHRFESDAKRFIVRFYRTEWLKLIFIAVLFVVVMKYMSASFLSLSAGYGIAQVLFWIMFSLLCK